MQPDMQAFRRCQAHATPRGGDITFKRQDTLANQTPDEMCKWHITGNCSKTTIDHDAV